MKRFSDFLYEKDCLDDECIAKAIETIKKNGFNPQEKDAALRKVQDTLSSIIHGDYYNSSDAVGVDLDEYPEAPEEYYDRYMDMSTKELVKLVKAELR